MGSGKETLPYRTKKVRRSLGYRDRKSSARKKYLSENPQYEGKILYYEDKQLVERTPEEVQEELMNKLMASDYVDYENEMAVKFQQAILMLPEKQRVVFNLRYYDELEYEEISRITDTKVDTLKVNYHYAKEKIKEYMINN